MDIQKLIAQARAQAAETRQETVDTVLGEEPISITLTKVDGLTWVNLTAIRPPRPGSQSDLIIGYDVDNIAGVYPADHVRINGEPIEQDAWAEVVELLESPARKLIAAALWGMHEHEPKRRYEQLLADRRKAAVGGGSDTGGAAE
jgi:hypothetical protein